MKTTSRELLDRFNQVLAEVHRDAAEGKLDASGRFYTDEELAAGAATSGASLQPVKRAEDPAA
jgi:hypothetical protein